MNNKNNTTVYVDFSALSSWNSKMNEINSSAITTLDSFISTTEELKDYWCGRSATGFLNSTKKLIDKAKSYHNEMKDVEEFLIKVINTMDSQ